MLVEHLRGATHTADQCYFALWGGFGSSVVPQYLTPKLELPQRDYHLFAGPLEAAPTNFAAAPGPFHQSANLWWPADQAWCVATEIDLAWTYVAASTACIAGVLADQRLGAVATSPTDTWW